MLLTTASDGHLALWKEGVVIQSPSNEIAAASVSDPRVVSWAFNSKIHQSAIKSLSSLKLSDSQILLLTGGDDNSIALTMISKEPFSTGSNQDILSSASVATLAVPRAHAAAVNASILLRKADSDSQGPGISTVVSLWAVTTGNDQRVKVWDVLVDVKKPGVDGVEIRRIGNMPTAVADVSSLVILDARPQTTRGPRILVCGVGMEIFRPRH